MTTAYTTFLGLALPVTGELSGTWGDTVNDYITQYLDASVAGTQTISGSQTAVTLSKTTNAALAQAGSSSTGSSQYQIINCTGNPASTLTITISYPTLTNAQFSKSYLVINSTSTSQSVVVQATTSSGTSTGVTLVSGEKAIIAWNGSDFIKVATSTADGVTTLSFGSTGLTPSTATSGAVTVAGTLVAANGGTGQSSYTTGDLLYATGSTALSKLGIGTNGQILTSTGTAPQWSTLSGVAVTTFSAGTTGFTPSSATSGAVTLAGTLATTNGGTGLTSFTANRVFYSSSTSAIGSSANLTFDGTTLTANALTTTSTVTINGGTANGVAYLNGSKVLTTGSELVFNGTNLGLGTGTPTGAGGRVFEVYSSGSISEVHLTNSTSGNTGLRGLTHLLNGVDAYAYNRENGAYIFGVNNAEQMRLTSTGLGIGTSSPATKLNLYGSNVAGVGQLKIDCPSGDFSQLTLFQNNVNQAFIRTNGSSLDMGSSTSIPFGFFTNGNERMRLDTSGNLGLGVTPSSASAVVRSFEFGQRGVLWATTSTSNSAFATNAVLDASSNWVYKQTGAANAYQQDGQHRWLTAPSGTAGNAISFTQAMTLDASGRLGIGVTNPGVGLVVAYGTDGIIGNFYSSGGSNSRISFSSAALLNNNVSIGSASDAMVMYTNNTERARITSGGEFGIGTSSPLARLDVQGGSIKVKGYTGLNSGDGYNINFGVTGNVGYIQSANGFSTNALSIDGSSIQFRTGAFVTAATLDSSGNLGLGVTPSAWNSSYKAFQFGPGGVMWSTGNAGARWGVNNFLNASNTLTYINSTYATDYRQSNGEHQWLTAASGTAGNAITFTQAMTLDASGNLVVGATSANSKLDVYGTIRSSRTENSGYYSEFKTNYSDVTTLQITVQGSTVFQAGATNDLNIYALGANNLKLYTNSTERARITSVGDLLVGTTSSGGSASNTTRVTGGVFSTFNSTPSIPHNTATTVATLPSGDAIYLASAALQSSGSPTGYNELAVIRVSQSTASVTVLVDASSLSISVSGLNVQITQSQGATQTCPFALIRLL